MPNPQWAYQKDGPAPGTAGYKTYLLFATPSGPKRQWVRSAAQETALKAAGIITRKAPLGMSLDALNEYMEVQS